MPMGIFLNYEVVVKYVQCCHGIIYKIIIKNSFAACPYCLSRLEPHAPSPLLIECINCSFIFELPILMFGTAVHGSGEMWVFNVVMGKEVSP